MTRKDYILLAEALNKAQNVHVSDDYQRGKKIGARVAAEFVADALAADNPKFARAHFIAVVRGDRALTSRPRK